MTSLTALRSLVGTGGGWVIHLLLLGSVLTVAVMVERVMVLHRQRKFLILLRRSVGGRLAEGDVAGAASACATIPGMAAQVLRAGLARSSAGPASVEERLLAARIEGKEILERRLWILATLGNNAPFVGLFGTVLGVIKAFQDLAGAANAGPEVVMAGLSEALIATAVGLLVALPAVVVYNYLIRQSAELLAETDVLCRYLMAALKEVGR